MTKADFVWTVGYSGNTALVNKTMKARFRNPNFGSLLEEGFLRAALCVALWEEAKEAKPLDGFVSLFNDRTGLGMGTDEIKRLLGVYKVPDDGVKTQQI